MRLLCKELPLFFHAFDALTRPPKLENVLSLRNYVVMWTEKLIKRENSVGRSWQLYPTFFLMIGQPQSVRESEHLPPLVVEVDHMRLLITRPARRCGGRAPRCTDRILIHLRREWGAALTLSVYVHFVCCGVILSELYCLIYYRLYSLIISYWRDFFILFLPNIWNYSIFLSSKKSTAVLNAADGEKEGWTVVGVSLHMSHLNLNKHYHVAACPAHHQNLVNITLKEGLHLWTVHGALYCFSGTWTPKTLLRYPRRAVKHWPNRLDWFCTVEGRLGFPFCSGEAAARPLFFRGCTLSEAA